MENYPIKLPQYRAVIQTPPTEETIPALKPNLLIAVQNGFNLFVTFLLYDDIRTSDQPISTRAIR
ncbi:MAG TPA: hypothetical protein VLK78_06780 [Candidatus Angelobacter sp.]|nr:hypothetical protein [Candidatus Angelobacter sp.]